MKVIQATVIKKRCKNLECLNTAEASSNRQDESSKQRDESQQIAAWQLLYRVQHPARYLSRLQTIPSPDFEPNYPRSTVRSKAAISQVRVLPPPEVAPSGKRGLGSDGRPRAPVLVSESLCFEPFDPRDSRESSLPRPDGIRP